MTINDVLIAEFTEQQASGLDSLTQRLNLKPWTEPGSSTSNRSVRRREGSRDLRGAFVTGESNIIESDGTQSENGSSLSTSTAGTSPPITPQEREEGCIDSTTAFDHSDTIFQEVRTSNDRYSNATTHLPSLQDAKSQGYPNHEHGVSLDLFRDLDEDPLASDAQILHPANWGRYNVKVVTIEWFEAVEGVWEEKGKEREGKRKRNGVGSLVGGDWGGVRGAEKRRAIEVRDGEGRLEILTR